VRSLRFIVKTVHNGDPDQKQTTVLTAGLIREFEKRRLQQAEQRATTGTRVGVIQRARNSTASFVRQARSIVALRKMKFYEDLRLPELTGFRGESVETPSRSLPRPLDMKALAAMEKAARKLAIEDPAVYVAHLLFSRLGLRNVEIVNARTHWISGGSIGIVNRPEENFFPKGCEGWVPFAPDVLKEILRFQSLAKDGYLVPGRNQTERNKAVYRRHSKWVSQWIKGRAKTSYELRRYAGSRLLDMGATIFEVRDFLRHRDVQTTQQWYAYRLQNRQLPTIGMRDLLPSSVTKQTSSVSC
jgi:integrase